MRCLKLQQLVLPLVAVAVFFFQSHQNQAVICCPWMCCELCAGSALLGSTASVDGEPESFTSNSFRCFISVGEMLRTVWGKRKQELAAVAGVAAREMGELPSHHNRMLRFLWESPPSTVPIPNECFTLGGGGSGRLMVRKRHCKECTISLFNYTLRKA